MKNRLNLATKFREMGFTKGAEIGVADGRFSANLCQRIPELKLYCIDPWASYPDNYRGGGQEQQKTNHKKAMEKLKNYDATLLQSMSVSASYGFENNSLDFVYIDGNHDFDYVMLDLIHWCRKVRKGGVVAGHDYYHFHGSGVIEAVNAYAAGHGITVNVIGEIRKHRNDDDNPSFWWVKK